MALPVQNSPPDLYDKYASQLDYIESQQRSLIAEFKAGERALLRTRLLGDQSQQREKQATKFGNSESEEDTVKSFKFNSLPSQIHDLKSEVDDLKSQVIDLKAQVIDLKAQVPDLKSEVLGLKSEVLGLKSQVHDLTAEVLRLKS
ncbi:hypothetical protein LguiA_001832 [Lonicera macranthoides]